MMLRKLWVLVVRTVRDARDDRVLELAAEVAFFAVFALPPTLLALLGAAGFVGDALGPGITQGIVQQVVAASATVLAPSTVEQVVKPTIEAVMSQGRADVLSIGALLALWSASRSSYVVMDTLTIAYDLEDVPRSFWWRRLMAVMFTLAGILLAAVVLPILVAGPRFGAALVRPLGLAEDFALVWRIAYWPLVVVLGVAVLTAIYHFSVPKKALAKRRNPFRRDVPGAVLALVLWLLIGMALRAYVSWTFTSSSIYGSLAAPMVLLLWLYFTALSVLMGAELNAEIGKMWPIEDGAERRADAEE